MSANRHLDPGIDTTLLKTHFAVVTDAVGALIFPMKSDTFPPAFNDPGLFESIHALFDAHVDPPLVFNQCLEVISINDLLWDDFQRNPHKLRVW